MKKKLLSLLLVICMVIGMLPVIAMAEVTNQDDFYLEYWNGESGKSHWTGISVAPGETEYLVQTEVDSDGYSYLITDGASADNYVIKVVYPAGEAPTVYFNGLDIVQPGSYGILFERDGTDGNGWTSNSDMNLVIEADSSITIDGEGTYGAIEFYCTATTTISSVNGAVLTAYGEDCTEGDATIWTRGDLVIDGAVLDIEADEGYAIGAAGTITIVDSDVTAVSEKATAFNKAPAIDAELGAIAGTARFNADEDLVEFVAEDVGTYKYVKIGADVTLPEIGGGEEGGDDEEVVLETFYLEYWNGADGWNGTSVAQGETKYLAQTAPDEATGYSYLIPTEDTENYVIKIVYPVGEAPTVYFNGLNMVNPAFRAILFERDGTDGNGWETRMDMNLVIEKDSSYIIDAESNYGGFEIYTTGTFTISSTVDPKTGKPAVLHMYAEDNRYGVDLSYAATIYARGDLVMDGAALDITADEGNAIGAAGTITIVDSEVTAWSEKFPAYNKAPVIDEELGAIAATTHVPNDPDLVEFDAAAADTYKFVKVGPGVELPAAFGSGEAWDVPVLNAGEAKYYLATEIGDLTEEGASAENYDVALVYDENGATIYLDGVNLKNPSPITLPAVDVEIVVEADSTLEATGEGYAINGTAGGACTITSENGAVLTLKAENPAGWTPVAGESNQTGGIATFGGEVTLLNANVNVEFDACANKYSGIFVANADLIIDNSVVNIGKGHTASTMVSPIQLVSYSDVADLVIQNGSDVTVLSEANARPCRVDGTVTISDSDVEFAGEYGGTRVIWPEGKPTSVTLNYTVPYTAKASTALPAVDPEAFTATIAEADLVPYADADVTTYFYVKITVDKAPAEEVTEAWDIPELAAGDAKYYVIDSEGALTETGASAENYKVAYIYEENGPTIYLNGVTMENEAPINYNGTAPLTIVVEADSSLYAVGNAYPAIVAPVDTVIKSEGEAVLTVTADGPANSFISTGNGGQVDGAIRVVGDLTLENANLNVEFPENCAKHSGIVVDGGNLIVDGGNLNIGKGYTVTANSLLQLMSDAEGNNGGMEIKNGANVVLMTEANGRPIRYDGAITISDSNFEAGSTDTANGRRIFRDILPTINGDVTIVGSTAVPTLDTVNFAMTAPADTAEVDAATLIDTKYYYVKITVNEEEPEVPVEPAYKFGVTVTCNETLDLNFYLPKDAISMAATWIVTYGDKVLEEGEYSLGLHTDGRMRVRVSYYPHQLNTQVSVTCKDANGVVLAQRSMSIQQYCMLYLGLSSGNAIDRALMVAMLEYGSLAQLGVANGDAALAGPLANRELTAAHRAYLTGYEWPTSGTPTVFAENNTTLPYSFSSSVTCNETLDLNFYLSAKATDQAASWTVTINGEEVSEGTYLISKDAKNRWRIRVPFLANQMNSLVSVTCKDAEGNVIAQRSNSIREYAMLYLGQASATPLDSALMVAMLEFGSLAQIGLNQTNILANYPLNDTYRAKLTQYAWPN